MVQVRLIILASILGVLAMAADEFPTRIPDKIKSCYVDKNINNRFNRYALSMDNLIAIIRKVEAHPDTALWTVGKMASTLLRRFRYDGIIDNPVVGPGLVPINRDSVETDKYALLWYLVPGHGDDFPESSLTDGEKCSLHWMLSYSVNQTLRSEERQVLRSPPNLRSINVPVNEVPAAVTVQVHPAEHNVSSGDKALNDDSSSEEIDEVKSVAQELVKSNAAEEINQVKAVAQELDDAAEEIDQVKSQENSVHSSSEVVKDTEIQIEDDGLISEQIESTDDELSIEFKRKKRQTYFPDVSSNHPLEVGIVRSKDGTVAAGVVLSGIAAGLEPQSVQLKDLIKNVIMEISPTSMERSVDSPWVATLAGDIAQTALLKASNEIASVGPRGNWNNTFCPREYLLETKDHSLLSISELYGGIDGLVIANQIAKWDTTFMKLSTLLEMYYSRNGVYGDSTYRACNRLNKFREIDMNQLREESINAALVYYAKGISGAPSFDSNYKPIDIISKYVEVTMKEIQDYLSSNDRIDKDFGQCSGEVIVPNIRVPATRSDVTFVIDQLNDPATIDQQKELVAALANSLDIQPGASRMEIVSSNDGNPFINLTATLNKADLACRIYNSDIGYNNRRSSDVLARMRSRIADERSKEGSNKMSGANSRVIIFFISSGSIDKDRMKVEIQQMIQQMPDVHLMFLTMGSAEEFRPFVTNFERDVIKMTKYQKYSDAAQEISVRLSAANARLFYPACKDRTSSASTIEKEFIYDGYLNPNTVQYFRIGPETFAASQDLTLRFKSKYGVVKFCYSRTNELPGIDKDTCSNALKDDETIEFKMNSPCTDIISCKPIYVSAISINTDDGIPCSDKYCSRPDQLKFTFSHDGMRCGNFAIDLTGSNLMLALTLLISWLHQKL